MFGRTLNLIAVSSTMIFLAIASCGLRFWAKAVKGRKLSVDDYLLLVGLVLACGICVCIIVGAACFRFGNHELWHGSGPDKFPQAWLLLGYGKLFYVMQILHTCAMPLIKGSFLIFLKQTFGISRRFRIEVYAVGGYVATWWFVIFWMTVFQCWPISYNWGTSAAEAGSCIPDYYKFYAWAALTNVLSDVVVAILPIPEIWKLKMSLRRKVLTSSILTLAALVIVAGVGRTVSYFEAPSFASDDDFTYKNYFFLIWTAIEPCLAIVGVCMPRMRPLFVDGYPSRVFDSLRSGSSGRSLLRTVFGRSNRSQNTQATHTAQSVSDEDIISFEDAMTDGSRKTSTKPDDSFPLQDIA